MNAQITQKSNVVLGVVPTHIKFAGGLVPDAAGNFPRSDMGELLVVAAMRELIEASAAEIAAVQIPFFAAASVDDVAEMVAAYRAMGLEVHFIIMVGGANPMEPADEDAVVSQLVSALKAAIAHGIRHVSSTSIEQWMNPGEVRRNGEAFEAAIVQNVKVHLRAFHEAGVDGSCIENWHMEFLRPGEFKSFTSIERGWAFVKAANLALGRKFFKLLVDAAHCGDSGLTLAENERLIAEISAAAEMGIFHASAKTTRGCLSTDDGWIGALLAAAARGGELRYVFVEVFHHEDAALELLRKLDPGHGLDTRDGRSYTKVTADGLEEIAHRLNNLAVRGVLHL